VLSRHLAHAGHYPAVDVLASVSRLVGEIVDPAVRAAGNDVRRLMATYKEKEDLISIGAYQPGSDPLTDAAIAARPAIEGFLRQSVEEPSSAEEADSRIAALAGQDPPPQVAAPEPQMAAGAAPTGGSGPGVPLHSAIPPLNLSA
jgi:flagellum-specific ATP synthase